MNIVVKLVKKEQNNWGVTLHIRIVHDINYFLDIHPTEERINELVEVSYQHGAYGSTGLWTMTIIDLAALPDIDQVIEDELDEGISRGIKWYEDFKISKYLSKILRHFPQHIGITLDHNNWSDIAPIIKVLNDKKMARIIGPVDLDRLVYIVQKDDKRRFEISPDKNKIRATYGHSHSDQT